MPYSVFHGPSWTDEDRAYALALAEYEGDLCPSCKAPMAETTNPENDGRYRPGLAVRCHRCTAIHVGSEAYKDSPQPGALFIPVVHHRPLVNGHHG